MVKYLQRTSKLLALSAVCLPIAGILLGVICVLMKQNAGKMSILALLLDSNTFLIYKVMLIAPMGLIIGGIYYLLYIAIIRKVNELFFLKEQVMNKSLTIDSIDMDNKYAVMAFYILEALGGKVNILGFSYGMTRIRIRVADMGLVDNQRLRETGVPGIVKQGEDKIQIIIGFCIEQVMKEVEKLMQVK
jgi:PTS system N-acetylglucosamine-specific IIC component